MQFDPALFDVAEVYRNETLKRTISSVTVNTNDLGIPRAQLLAWEPMLKEYPDARLTMLLEEEQAGVHAPPRVRVGLSNTKHSGRSGACCVSVWH